MGTGEPLALQHLTLHGHRRAFLKAGSGPALLLLHGMGCDHTTWDLVVESFARRYTVIAPDLLGHGASDKPRADYSVGGYANGMRDLLAALDIDRATVVGHSLGGGVAMQFAYQYPELAERLVLVAPGGFGPEVTPIIRAVTTPGFHQITGLLTLPGVRQLGVAGLTALSRSRLPGTRDLGEVAAIFSALRDPRARAALAHVVRAVVDWRGQIITMSDRAYLTDDIPMCVIWGDDDPVIPVSHAEVARVVAPHCDVEIVPNAGHFPHRDHPERFVKLVNDFVRSTAPARFEWEQWRDHLRRGGDVRIRQAEAGHAPVAPLASAPSA
ncbi:MAG TPA: alpha/beta fold hydrolase [Nocardioides sp.]|uniref:alpha/beta fold hydrolase n=1 Tax=Nocardioides sp. TaxID=35761 RepID=UPI002C6BFF01|nr:alpha/beta fold hydrolase [Nocardioides sp.]HQR26482.1 alpha/beta fold hydrolase [Nocardioides sp.]